MHDREKKKTRRDSGSYDRDQVNCQRFNSQSEGTRNLPSLPPRARFCRLRLCQRDGRTTCHDNTVKINVEFESSESRATYSHATLIPLHPFHLHHDQHRALPSSSISVLLFSINIFILFIYKTPG